MSGALSWASIEKGGRSGLGTLHKEEEIEEERDSSDKIERKGGWDWPDARRLQLSQPAAALSGPSLNFFCGLLAWPKRAFLTNLHSEHV